MGEVSEGEREDVALLEVMVRNSKARVEINCSWETYRGPVIITDNLIGRHSY